MNALRSLEIKVGLLVLLAIAAVVSLVLTADRLRFEGRYQVTALLRDAGGLRERSPVTLAGIPVGSVRSIGADPASGRIRAVLVVDTSIDLPADVRARLASSGLFGDSSLALSSAGGAGGSLPKDGSALVEVSPGFFDEAGERAGRILDAASDLLSERTREDAKRLLGSSADLAAHAASVAARIDRQGERLDTLLADLGAAAHELRTAAETVNRRLDPLLAHLDQAVTGIDRRAAALAERADGVLVRGDAALARIDALAAEAGPRLNASLDALRTALGDASRLASRLADGDGLLWQLVGNRELARSVARMAVDLESAARAMADRPSVLVFDDDGSHRRAEAVRREREKMRRILDDGLAPAPAATAASP